MIRPLSLSMIICDIFQFETDKSFHEMQTNRATVVAPMHFNTFLELVNTAS